MSLLREMLATILPSLHQTSSAALKEVEECRVNIVESARKAGTINEEIFRNKLMALEGSIWSERVEIKGLGDLVRFVGHRLKKSAKKIEEALETVIKACLDGFFGYSNARLNRFTIYTKPCRKTNVHTYYSV